MKYQDWKDYQSRLQKRDVGADEQDYDLEGYYNTLKHSEEPGHLPDTFKKPNHPTFSEQSKYNVPVIQQGGSWEGDSFTPSELNKKNMSSAQMQGYFNEVESPEALNLPDEEKASMAKRSALEALKKR
jgi:hypothetical protein